MELYQRVDCGDYVIKGDDCNYDDVENDDDDNIKGRYTRRFLKELIVVMLMIVI